MLEDQERCEQSELWQAPRLRHQHQIAVSVASPDSDEALRVVKDQHCWPIATTV